MCISKVSGVTHTNNTQYDTSNTKNGESEQEAHAPFFVPGFVDGVAGEHRETPHDAEDEVERQEDEECESGE